MPIAAQVSTPGRKEWSQDILFADTSTCWMYVITTLRCRPGDHRGLVLVLDNEDLACGVWTCRSQMYIRLIWFSTYDKANGKADGPATAIRGNLALLQEQRLIPLGS